MADARPDNRDPTTLPLRRLIYLELSALNAGDIQKIGSRADRAFMRISCREITSPSQKRCMTQWQTLKTRCDAELQRRDPDKVFSRQTSYDGGKTDTDIALAWHRKFFSNITRR